MRAILRYSTFSTAVWLLTAWPASAFAQERTGKPGPEKDRRLAALIDQLGDERYTLREQAMRAIIAYGPTIAPRLREWLAGEPDAEIRYRLRYILENIVPPERAALLIRAAPETRLKPGTLITHVSARRVRSEAGLRRRMRDRSAGLMLRITDADGPREVGPIRLDELIELTDYQAPRGEVIAQAVRLYATGYAERAYAALRSIESAIPPSELTAALHARIAYVAGDGATARQLLEHVGASGEGALLARDWGGRSPFELTGPGSAPFHLEWRLYTSAAGQALDDGRDPDLRVQRVLVPANRFVDALYRSAELWTTRFRAALGDRDATPIAGNMLAVSSWMLSDLELLSECLRLVEPRSVILRRGGRGIRKWIRVRTDAWLPFLAGDAQAALDGLYEDARDVLQRPREGTMLIRNPRIAAVVAFFLYQFPNDPRVAEMLRVVNHPGQLGLPEYAHWMMYAVSGRNHTVVREHLAAILPTFADAEAAPAARAVALLEYVQKDPDDDVFAAARHRLEQSPATPERAVWLAVVDTLRHLRGERVDAARDALAEFADDPVAAALWHTIRFRLEPPAGAVDRAILRSPLLAVPVGRDGAAWLILARDRRLLRFDVTEGALSALDRPTPTWFPGPLTWPWIGREESSGRVWVYGRRRVLEVCNDDGRALRLCIRVADVPAFDRYAGPSFSTLAAVAGATALPPGERGEFLHAGVKANREYTTDPDLPEIGLVQAVANDENVIHVALRGGPHLLVDAQTRKSWTSHWIAAQLGLAAPPAFFARGLRRNDASAAPVVYLMSDQGLIRFNYEAEELERIAIPGAEPFPPLVPENAPYDRHDPRWVYCARLPEDGGAVFRVAVADNTVEQIDMINEALPPGYYRVRSRAALRAEIDRRFAAAGMPPLNEFVEKVKETVARWQGD